MYLLDPLVPLLLSKPVFHFIITKIGKAQHHDLLINSSVSSHTRLQADSEQNSNPVWYRDTKSLISASDLANRLLFLFIHLVGQVGKASKQLFTYKSRQPGRQLHYSTLQPSHCGLPQSPEVRLPEYRQWRTSERSEYTRYG